MNNSFKLFFNPFLLLFLFAASSLSAKEKSGVLNDSKLLFDENKNQWPTQVKFHVEVPGVNLWLEKDALTYLLSEKVDFHDFSKTQNTPITGELVPAFLQFFF